MIPFPVAQSAFEDASTISWLAPPAELDSGLVQNDGQSICKICLGLDYSLFRPLEPPSITDDEAVRYHVCRIEALIESSRGQCPLCEMLCEGMSVLWGDVEGERELEVGNKAEVMPWLFLESRPTKPLRLFRKAVLTALPELERLPRIEFFTTSGQPIVHPAFGVAGEVSAGLDMIRCVDVLRVWLEKCDSSHDICLAISRRMPKRLLRIAEDQPYLADTENMQYSKYATLSHCWGEAPDIIKTTISNIHSRRSAIKWDELPCIFRDAIAVAKTISCEWIWIDSLCIIQDDEEDWKTHSRDMAEIYSNGYLNIAATLSPDSNGTLFSQRHIYQDAPPGWHTRSIKSVKLQLGSHRNSIVNARVAPVSIHQCFTNNYLYSRHVDAPLLCRAWVLQERLLAPRTVHFTSSEMIWECNTSLLCECSGIGVELWDRPLKPSGDTTNLGTRPGIGLKSRVGTNLGRVPETQRRLLDLWLEIVETYSSLDLTKTSDRPFALAGLVSRLAEHLASDYIEGHWTADFPRSLLWFARGRSSSSRLRVSSDAPTWSWMSQYMPPYGTAPVDLFVTGDFKSDPRVEIHPFAASSGQSNFKTHMLKVRAPAKEARIKAQVSGEELMEDTPELFIKVEPYPSHLLLWADTPAVDNVVADLEVLCLLLGTVQAEVEPEEYILVLKKEVEDVHYTRVGVATSAHDFSEDSNGRVFDGAEVKEIILR